MTTPTLNLVGQRFGRLVVLRRAQTQSDRRTRWLCRCDCGTQKPVAAKFLLDGSTKSCGCLRTGPASERTPRVRLPPRQSRSSMAREYRDQLLADGHRETCAERRADALLAGTVVVCGCPLNAVPAVAARLDSFAVSRPGA